MLQSMKVLSFSNYPETCESRDWLDKQQCYWYPSFLAAAQPASPNITLHLMLNIEELLTLYVKKLLLYVKFTGVLLNFLK